MWDHVLFWDFLLKLGCFNVLLWSLVTLLTFMRISIMILNLFLLPLFPVLFGLFINK